MVHLNDSKFIAIAIYNVTIPSIIIAPLVHLLDIDKPTVTFVLTASCITFGTTITNCLIFVPKVRIWRFFFIKKKLKHLAYTGVKIILSHNGPILWTQNSFWKYIIYGYLKLTISVNNPHWSYNVEQYCYIRISSPGHKTHFENISCTHSNLSSCWRPPQK